MTGNNNNSKTQKETNPITTLLFQYLLKDNYKTHKARHDQRILKQIQKVKDAEKEAQITFTQDSKAMTCCIKKRSSTTIKELPIFDSYDLKSIYHHCNYEHEIIQKAEEHFFSCLLQRRSDYKLADIEIATQDQGAYGDASKDIENITTEI